MYSLRENLYDLSQAGWRSVVRTEQNRGVAITYQRYTARPSPRDRQLAALDEPLYGSLRHI